MKVDVVGAGIAGLAVAAGLQCAGATVTVRERQPDATQNGSGLSLFTNGIAALEALGLADVVRAAAGSSPMQPSGLRRPDGRWLSRLGPRAVAGLRVIERQRLHQVLHEALRPGTVHFAEQVDPPDHLSSVSSDADLLVAADGIRSAHRAGWSHDPGTRYAGYFAFRAITREPVSLDALGETWGAGRRFGMAPLADGRVYWFATVNAERDRPPTTELAHVRELFGQWHDPIPAILNATSADAITVLPIDELARCASPLWRNNVVLIGDSAHAMTPNLGQGANLALEDAATLTALLATYATDPQPSADDIHRALQSYQRQRAPRLRAIAKRSRRLGSVGQWSNRVGVKARDGVLAALPDAVISTSTVKVHRWTPLDSSPITSVFGSK